MSNQPDSDQWDGWTCIPGRPCGGSNFMREAKVEIDRLNAEVSVLQGFIASMIKGLSVELPETMELVQAEFDNLYSDSGSQTDREAIESVLDDPKAPWNHDPTCPLHRVEDGECTCADSGNPGRVHDEKCRYWTDRQCNCAMAKFVEKGQKPNV